MELLNLYGYWPMMLEGTRLTIWVAISSLIISVCLGMFGAACKLSDSFILQKSSQAYTTIIRGVPDLVMMLLLFYGGQILINDITQMFNEDLYLDIDPYIAGVSTIGFIYGAYMTETFRGAILAVDKGQLEAGHAYGMTKFQVFFRILVPQMIRHAIPGFGNLWLVLLKATALLSIIGLDDMVRNAKVAGGSTRMPFTFFLVVAVNYLIITSISVYLLKMLENRYTLGVRKS